MVPADPKVLSLATAAHLLAARLERAIELITGKPCARARVI